MSDPFDLVRFVEAQRPVYAEVLAELRQGSKRGHWIWFIFPQMKGLGHSATAQRYGIASRAEAEAFLAHPILARRLKECTELVIQIEGRSAEDVFGFVDAMKVRSSMTLFAEAAQDRSLFDSVLRKYYGGKPDPLTLDLLQRA